VKVSSPDTGGAFALMEDNLKLEFALGLHLHRQHAETCYTLDGEINFLHRRRLDGPHIRIGRRADRKEWLHSQNNRGGIRANSWQFGFFQWQSGTLEPKATLTFGR
jgi:hypothetical protein